jgi:hypothetical protein
MTMKTGTIEQKKIPKLGELETELENELTNAYDNGRTMRIKNLN